MEKRDSDELDEGCGYPDRRGHAFTDPIVPAKPKLPTEAQLDKISHLLERAQAAVRECRAGESHQEPERMLWSALEDIVTEVMREKPG